MVILPTIRHLHIQKFQNGGYTDRPTPDRKYRVTAVDSNAYTVLAIPIDYRYTDETMGRVMLRVGDNIIRAGTGTEFIREGDRRDHIVVVVTTQVEKTTIKYAD